MLLLSAVLEGVLPPSFHEHLALLVTSLHILLGECITVNDLALAETF